MSEPDDGAAPIGVASLEGSTAGAMLRAAREGRGLHIAALAASIKVTPRKLEALEADRYDELPDMTFTRALAQTVCRALKVDAEPVLAKLPRAGDLPKLAHLGGGLNEPFRMAPGSRDPGDFTFYRSPVFWATLIILVGALALAFLPERWMPWRAALGSQPAGVVAAATAASPAISSSAAQPGVTRAANTTSAATPSGSTIPVTAALVAPSSAEPAASSPVVSTAAGDAAGSSAALLNVRTSAESWVEVQDGRGQVLLSRVVQPGETVGLDGSLPLRLTIGNAAVTQLSFRGQAVELASSTRDNVARLQLPAR